MSTKQSRLGQIVRFCLSGFVSVGLSYATLYCLTEYARVWYMASAAVATVLNYTLNFLLHKFWTFGEKSMKAVPRQAGKYVAMVTTFYVTGAVSMYVMVEWLHIWYMYAQVILTVIISIISFVVTKWIFTPKTN